MWLWSLCVFPSFILAFFFFSFSCWCYGLGGFCMVLCVGFFFFPLLVHWFLGPFCSVFGLSLCMSFLKIRFYFCISVSVLFFLSQYCRRNDCLKLHNIYFYYLWLSPQICFSNKYLMWSQVQYIGVTPMIILKERFSQLCLKIGRIETECLWTSTLSSRAKQTQKSNLSDWPFPARKLGCLKVAFPMINF